MFECKIKDGYKPTFHTDPDPNKTDVKWIPISKLHNIIFYPNIKELKLDYVADKV